jgi:hypothetical protein
MSQRHPYKYRMCDGVFEPIDDYYTGDYASTPGIEFYTFEDNVMSLLSSSLILW